MASTLPAPAIGIDLGTTFSCVAVFVNGKVEIIKNQDSKSTMPSYVAFTDNGRLVGERAKQRALIDPENTVNNMKRLIGRTLDDRDVAEDILTYPFRVVSDASGHPKVQVKFQGEETQFSPEEISAAVLTELKTVAEEFLGQTVKDAVITVPAYFTDAQRQATMDAGRIAGLKVLGTINEPTAAALAYGFDNTENDKKTVLVYDFGGGTFDVSILNIENASVEVLSTGGSGHLGGEDIDNILLKHFSETFKKKHNIDLIEVSKPFTETGRKAKRALRRLRYGCEKAKIKLSSEREARIEMDLLYDNRDLEEKIVRRFFESLCEDLVRSTVPKVMGTIEEANLAQNDISEIILVGGSTRIPMVTEMLSEIFPDVNICGSVNPDEAVAYGAAIQAAILSGVNRNIVRNVHLRDVTPMSLGVETFGGIMATIIPRNTAVPVTRTKVFSTSKDYQTEICFQVFEGERHMTKHNNVLGEFTLVGVPPAPRRVPQIEVTFYVNENGILQVKAMDLSTECENGIEITNNRGRLNPDDITRAIEEARRMRQQDLQYKKKIQARETLEIYANKIERTLKNSKIKEKLTADELQKIEDLVDESLRLYESCQNPDVTNFEDKRVQLEKLWLPIIKRCYPERKSGNSDAPVQVDDSFYE